MATRSKKGSPRKGEPKAQRAEGEYRTGPVVGTALVSGVTFARKGLLYAEVDGRAIFEGDIDLGPVEEVAAAAEFDPGVEPLASVVVTAGAGNIRRWPNNRVPYDIEAGLPNQQRITDAIAHWEANTRIRFVLRTAANAAQFPDWVRFRSGGGCSSMVGRQGGMQFITLSSGCTKGNVIHEIGHAVGLWHEQSREDRDNFITIVWANIDPAAQHNFSQHIADGDDIGPYDYGSMMHYPPTAFSINGQPTIIPKQPLPPGVVMGQRNGLSQGDINGVHTIYPQIGGVTIKEVAKDPITDPATTIKEIARDPVTIKEVRKDPITDTVTIKEIGKDPIQDTFIERTGIPRPGPRLPGFDPNATVSPFVMATPSQYAGADVMAAAYAQVQEIAAALAAMQQQQAELVNAYQEAVQTLDALQHGGQGQ